MEQFKAFLNKIFLYLGIHNDDEKISITNICVYVFLIITAFRSLFGTATFSFNDFKWTVQTIDVSDTLPLLFSLINYSTKRATLTAAQNKVQTEKDSNVPRS